MDNRQAFLLLSMSLLVQLQNFVYAFMKRRIKRRRLEMWRVVELDHRRRVRMINMYSAALLYKNPRHRRMWKRDRSHEWWDKTVTNFDNEQWLENFRMRKETFDFLCSKLEVILAPNPQAVIQSQPLPARKIVAIAVYKLAHVAEYKVVGNQFGVHKSTVHNCVYAFCLAVTHLLSGQYIHMPNESEAQEIARRFEEKTHIPQLIGAIDGSHIPITAPEEGHADFVNRKMFTSVVLQAIVDDQLIFRDVSCKLPGSYHDADALRESTFYQHRDTILPKGFKVVDGMEIPYMIMGDPAYPLQTWLVKNYTYDANISPEMDSFNVHLNKGRVVVENAFGRLKGRWRVLLKRTEIHYTFVPTVVATCCILHNLCEQSRDTFNNYWLQAVEEAENEFPQDDPQWYDAENQPDAVDIRDHLMLYLARNYELLSSIRGRYAIM